MCPMYYQNDRIIHNHLKHTYWISYVLPSRNNYAKCEQDYWADRPM